MGMESQDFDALGVMLSMILGIVGVVLPTIFIERALREQDRKAADSPATAAAASAGTQCR